MPTAQRYGVLVTISYTHMGSEADLLAYAPATAGHNGVDIPRCFPLLVPTGFDAVASVARPAEESTHAAGLSPHLCTPAVPDGPA